MDSIYTILESLDQVEEGRYDGPDSSCCDAPLKNYENGMGICSDCGEHASPHEDEEELDEAMHDVNEEDVEENAFNQAAAAAARAGKKEFEFGGKTHPVKMDKATAHQLDDDVNEDAYSEMPEEMKKKIIAQYAKMVGGDMKKAEAMLRKALSPEGQAVIKDKMGIKDSLGEDYDKDEYDEEGEMADNQLDVVHDAAQELQDIIDSDDNLPEWVQSKITKAMDYLDTARDYMKSVEDDEEDLEERSLTAGEKDRMKELEKEIDMKDFVERYGKEKGESVYYATITKMAKKGKKKTDETTVAGAVATSADATGSSVYSNPSVYESMDKKFQNILSESMNVSVNSSNDPNSVPSITVSASGEDAMALAQLLKLASVPQAQQPCESCGEMHEGECTMEDYANQPEEQTQDTEFMTKTISGGLNGPKIQVNPNNPGDNPLAMQELDKTAVNLTDSIREGLDNLYKQYKGE